MNPTANTVVTTPETLITIKVAIEGSNRKFKLPLRDLNAAVFSDKIRSLLAIPGGQGLLLERYSDSGNAYIALDTSVPSAYKQLYRAAKAKLKLRIRATIIQETYSRRVESVAPTFGGVRLPEISSVRSIHGLGELERRCEDLFSKPTNVSDEPPSSWQVFCNNCDRPMADTHFHCGICDHGDYDLCESCVANGKTCAGHGHWLIKRFIKSGKVINSTTERLPPKQRQVSENEHEMPGAFKSDTKVEISQEPKRTCNACVTVFPEKVLVTCSDCPDYDLCMACFHQENGHHPGHSFHATVSAVADATAASVGAPGLRTRHHAICDGCDKHIYGVRHKCLNCPDWDYCTKCHENAHVDHPNHRFVPVYVALDTPAKAGGNHHGIYCDGPLCIQTSHQSCIKGIRYKCAICHDLDFCASCEAHPSNKHNVTHPLIKFKTPVRDVSITTLQSDKNGREVASLGDKRQLVTPRPVCKSPLRQSQQGASTANLPPYTPVAESVSPTNSYKTVPTAASPVSVDDKAVGVPLELDAHFMHDTVVDGTEMAPDTEFVQTWKLMNPGPNVWPQGCTVCHVGGDNMLNIDRTQASSVSDLIAAQRSNSTTRRIGAGGEFEFSVTMRSPLREGKHISYWRLKTADGVPFGHKLWCDVEVKALAEKAPEPKLEDSLMVFPTLEKESPSSSMYQETTSATSIVTAPEQPTQLAAMHATVADAGIETETETETAATGDDHFEDVESVEFEDSESDDGFMTDEEYDILDASDEEVQKSGKNGL